MVEQVRRRFGPLAVTLAVLAGAGAVRCGGAGDATAGNADAADPFRRGPFRQVVLLTGELDAVTGHPVVVPRLPSWRVPIRWLIADGAAVERGDRVAELDSSEIVSQLDARRIALDGARNELAAKRAELAATEAEKRQAYGRSEIEQRRARIEAAVPAEILPMRTWQERQLALERATTERDKAREDLDAFLEAAAADLEVLRIEVDTAARELDVAERALEDMVLTAPRSGIVVVAENRREGRKFQVGDDAWVGLELLRVPELDRMRVRARLFDVDDGRIVPGQQATCTLDTYPDRAHPCEVEAIRPVAQEFGRRSERRAFDVDLRLAESDPEVMRPGMSVRVEVETDARDDVPLVRRETLRFEADGTVRIAGHPRSGPLRLGPCNAFDCVVLDADGRAGGAP